MKRKLFIVCSLILVGNFVQAQSIERFVLGSTGNSVSFTEVQVDFTMGEAVISTESAGNVRLTQGFQQPDDLSDVGVSELDSDALKIYPNPALDHIIIEGLNVGFRITNSLGQELLVGTKEDSIIDVSKFDSGMYYMHSAGSTVCFMVIE